jgi:HD-GYP domain-containing protein (c-di-GMP phosphodiesterase class II)
MTDRPIAPRRLDAEFAERLQPQARQLIAGFHMLVRSAKLYDPDNDIFAAPLERFREILNQFVVNEGQLALVLARDSFYLNQVMIKLDFQNLENARQLAAELRRLDLGGFTVSSPVMTEELRSFVAVFARGVEGPIGEGGLPGRELTSIRFQEWIPLEERYEGKAEEDLPPPERALTLYARTLYFMQKYLETRAAGRRPVPSRGARLVQDWVDLFGKERALYFRMTALRGEGDQARLHHAVNVCLLAIALGSDLGLTRTQLRELGYAGLFQGMARIQEAPGTSSSAESGVDVARLLSEEGFNRLSMVRLVDALERPENWSRPRDPTAERPSVFSRILAICSAFDTLTSAEGARPAFRPDVALRKMATELSESFDGDLLVAFARTIHARPHHPDPSKPHPSN